MKQLNSIIIGPGAIGALVCGHVQGTHNCYAFSHRNELSLPATLKHQGRSTALSWQTIDLERLKAGSIEFDLIWVCCKAPYVYESTRDLLKALPDTSAILLNNGMGPQQKLSNEFGRRVIWGATTCAALRIDSSTIEQTAQGTTWLGLPDQSEVIENVRAKVHSARPSAERLLNTRLTDSIEQKLWQKILVNAVINPITAFHQIPNGELLNPEYSDDISAICQEVTCIMRHSGIEPVPDPESVIRNVAELTAANRSSMAEDVRLGRPNEIDYINGFLISQAEQHVIACPALKKWYRAIAEK